MQRFTNLEQWKPLVAGTAIAFPVGRTLKLHVSTPANTNWYLTTDDDEEGEYLCTTTGKETIEIGVQNGQTLQADQTVRYHTASMKVDHVPARDIEPYAQPVMRDEIDPVIQDLIDKTTRRARLREIQQAGEIRRLQEANSALTEKIDAETGEVISVQPASTGDSPSVPEPKPDDPKTPPAVAGETPPANAGDTAEAKSGEPAHS